MNNNEQWLLEGNCSICRRVNYCNKDCTARKKYKGAIIQKAFVDVMEEKNPGYKNFINRLENIN